jgi:vacuolar-type H+-ATPase subunit I/STV1
MTTFIDTVSSLSIKDKRALVKSIREMIKDDIITNKRIKALSSKQKEQEKKIKIEAQIKAAADKLAKLQAKLTA